MATPPTKQSVLNLYHSMLRTSQSFTSYNFRTYFNESDPAKLAAFYAEKSQELAVLKRSAIVNQLYGGRRLVVEDQKPVRDRGDT